MALIPLESNPEVMTKFMHKIGVPSKWSLTDVYGLDPDILAIVPKPVLALILLYPDNEKSNAYSAELVAKITEKGQEVSPNLFHMKQCVSNACGTIALIHAIANNLDQIQLKDGILKTFLDKAKDLSYEEKGMLLVDSASEIISAHENSAQEGQTPVPPNNTPASHHFVAFVEKDGSLYELDGRKTIPINHGETTKENFLQSAAKICGEYMSREPEQLSFTMIALAAAADE